MSTNVNYMQVRFEDFENKIKLNVLENKPVFEDIKIIGGCRILRNVKKEFDEIYDIYIKRPTIIINGMEVPKPISTYEEYCDYVDEGNSVFLLMLSNDNGYIEKKHIDNLLSIERGLVHKTKEDVLKHFHAIID